jgi:hypothetical protein
VGWELATVEKLDEELLDALFDNDIAGIRVSDFLGRPALRAAVRGIEGHGMDYYADVEPPIGRIGITQFEHRHSEQRMAEYFAAAPDATARRRRIFADGVDPLEQVQASLRSMWPHQVRLAAEADGREYFAGLIRHISLGLLHCDWAPFDAPAWAIGTVSAQVSWNVYCQVSSEGGATLVYDRPWNEVAQRCAIEGSYGYTDDVVAGCRSVRLAPVAGDLIMFNSRNFHRIEHSSGGHRLSVSSFVGRQPDGDVVLWS